MSASRDWRIWLFVFITLISAMLIIRPGIKYGVDIVGGSRITLRLEASHVTIKIEDLSKLDNLVRTLEDNLLSTVKVIRYEENTKQITLEVGRAVTEDMISGIIDNLGQFVKLEENKVSDETRDEIMHMLQARVDPYGTIGAQFKPLGMNFILFEVSGIEPERAKELLGRQGKLEAFVDNTLVLRGGDIVRVGLVRIELVSGGYRYHVPFEISDDAARRFADASAGKAGHCLAIYLDRSDDAVLIFDRQLLGELETFAYDENRRMFGHRTAGFPVMVPAAAVTHGPLDAETLEFLRGRREFVIRAILLGEEKDFSSEVIDKIKELFPIIESIPRPADQIADEWIRKACGLESWPQIESDVAGKAVTNVEITGVRSSRDAAERDARDLQILLSQRLPVKISFEGETVIEPRLGAEIKNEAMRAAIGAIVGVFAMLYIRYRRFRIAGAIVGTMICELIITLGLASAIHWTIGLPEIGGLIAVIGSGVDHQIVITDEILRGVTPQVRKVSIRGRIGRAFSVIFAAAATTIAAMVCLATLGFGVMRGFALITIIGVLSAVLITRPAYARIASALLSKELMGEGAA